MTWFEWILVVLAVAFLSLAVGANAGKKSADDYWQKWTEGFGVGEWYLDGHSARFRLKKGDCK